jgi:hypothetical protein
MYVPNNGPARTARSGHNPRVSSYQIPLHEKQLCLRFSLNPPQLAVLTPPPLTNFFEARSSIHRSKWETNPHRPSLSGLVQVVVSGMRRGSTLILLFSHTVPAHSRYYRKVLTFIRRSRELRYNRAMPSPEGFWNRFAQSIEQFGQAVAKFAEHVRASWERVTEGMALNQLWNEFSRLRKTHSKPLGR